MWVLNLMSPPSTDYTSIFQPYYETWYPFKNRECIITQKQQSQQGCREYKNNSQERNQLWAILRLG